MSSSQENLVRVPQPSNSASLILGTSPQKRSLQALRTFEISGRCGRNKTLLVAGGLVEPEDFTAQSERASLGSAVAKGMH